MSTCSNPLFIKCMFCLVTLNDVPGKNEASAHQEQRLENVMLKSGVTCGDDG